MMPDSMFESQNFQENIDRIRLEQQVYGVMLFGQRNHKPLPINVYDIDIYEQLGIFNEEI